MAKIINFPTNYKPQTEYKNVQQQSSPVVDCYNDNFAMSEIDVFIPHSSLDFLKNEAITLYDRALSTRIDVSKLIFKAADNNFDDCIINGKEITFSENRIGRLILTEHNKKGKEVRKTTFDRQDGRVVKVETLPDEKIVFFDYGRDYTEITRTTKKNFLGAKEKEVFSYECGRPVSYNKYEKQPFKEDVLIESCYF